MNTLIAKYNVPGPRYTSYPTVPYWDPATFSPARWRDLLRQAFDESNDAEGIGLYVHLPFCESPCTFCGCIKKFTRDHGVEAPYVETVLREWSQYLRLLGNTPNVRELHLGGGTPTFFSPERLTRLVQGLFDAASVAADHEFGFEGHPGSTTGEHLAALHELGFRRVSFGIQDFDPEVQRTINRIQSVEQVTSVTRAAREAGFDSINFDLVYGLPRQRPESVRETVRRVIELAPDRIAFYGYAHVPWIKGLAQRRFTEVDLPRGADKLALYALGRELLFEAGYREIGMDHFARPGDPLYRAIEARSVHRNFMGYTPRHTRVSIGLGMSAIGDAWYAFAQNEKTLTQYTRRVHADELPVHRGHVLDAEDRRLRRLILDLMCRLEARVDDTDAIARAGRGRLAEMVDDDLVVLDDDAVRITEAGRAFVRNACMAFDARLWRTKPNAQLFSSTI